MQATAADRYESSWSKLGVPADADEVTIKKAYRRLVLKCARTDPPYCSRKCYDGRTRYSPVPLQLSSALISSVHAAMLASTSMA